MNNKFQYFQFIKLTIASIFFLMLTGCATMYVDGTTKEIKASEYKVQQEKQAVMLVFEFQTKGVANAQATKYLKDKIVDQVKSSGIFSEVSLSPVAGNRVLSITLNNVPLSDDAFSKGFVTGLTFGLAGSSVSDGYVCTARYLGGDQQQPIVTQARHAIHTTLGAKGSPDNATKAANAEEAVTLMTRQIVSHVLFDMTQDAGFK